ncbi:MAG: hypothetical protein IJI44_08560, partial [Erysipelotrichaceae bacterium]|nr:hypothetical protein [Erysipelotrichaceae bacterium]
MSDLSGFTRHEHFSKEFPTMKSVKTGSEGNSVSAEASEKAKAPADSFAAPSKPIDFSNVVIE